MAITKIAHSSLEENQQNYINILRIGHSVTDTGWTTYSDSAGVNPVDGIGGTASITWSQNTSNPLSGDSDLRLVKDAVNRQGDGVSIPFTIANRHLGKVLQITFDMELFSGTYASGDLRVSVIQDPTGTPVVLEPVNTGIQLGITNQRIRHIASFQTHISITSYRLCIHVSSTSASAYTVDFANFKVWETTQSVGSIITEPVLYTPTFVGMSPTSVVFTWQRVGKNIKIKGRGIVASNTSTQWSITTPNGIVPDLGYTSGDGILIGQMIRGASSDGNVLSLLGRNDNLIRLGSYLALNGGANPLSWSTWNPFNSGEAFNLDVEFPIQGWGSSVAMSSDSGDGRVVACQYRSINSGTSSTTQPINYATREYDTHNAVTLGTPSATYASGNAWKFTAPISGIYRVTASSDGSGSQNIRCYVNGIARTYTGLGIGTVGGGTTTVSLNSGDILDVRTDSSMTVSSGNDGRAISIERISAGSQVIATAETVACSVNKTSGNVPSGSSSPGIVTSWNTKDLDTHGSFNLTSGTFTVPMSGVYLINVTANNLGNFTSYNQPGFRICSGPIGATTSLSFSTMYSTVSMEPELSTSALRRFVAGDIISLYGYGSGFACNNLIMNISRIGL
jgi:hypothetical protein